MVRVISKSLFKPKALEYLRLAEETGIGLTITDHGRPVVKITPHVPGEKSALKALRKSVLRYEGPTEPVAAEACDALR
ncbi:MAG: type II toxin-antitoxin system prevent-host-death family antitoxin [Thiobacillaceae bacterium]